MEIYKLNQGSTFDNLKHFIYLTNEYGKTSSEFVDDFIEQFGKIILNGNFKLNQYELKQLDNIWLDVVENCKSNNIEYTKTYGNLFYNTIGTKALNKIKEDWKESEWNQLSEIDKLELLKDFIKCFDEYIMDGIDMRQLYLENTPELVKLDENNRKYIEIYMKTSTCSSKARLYEDSTTVIEIDSTISKIKKSTLDRPTVYSKILRDKENKVIDSKVIKEITCKSPSGAGMVCMGGACNGWNYWHNKNGDCIDLYRTQNTSYTTGYTKIKSENTVSNNKDLPKNELILNLMSQIESDIPPVVVKPKYNYRVTNERYIGHYLTIEEQVNEEIYTYKAKVIDEEYIQKDNEELKISINKFIEETENRTDRLIIKMGFFRFTDIYMEV